MLFNFDVFTYLASQVALIFKENVITVLYSYRT